MEGRIVKALTRMLGTVSILGLVMGMAVEAEAEGPPISQVVVVDTQGNTDKLLSYAKSNQAIFKRLGIKARRRYLQASFAGPNAGSVAVVIEYPSLAALAAAQEKLANDKEWQSYIDDITDADMTVESNAIWVEVTP